MSNRDAFKAFLGSLLFENAKQHQYLWCHGLGSDGKGAINRFLKQVFGRSYRSKQPPAPGDKFWTHGLLGSRLVVFPDCNAQTFTSSGLFKSLSGGDPVDVEAKGLMSFTAVLDCKFIFLSNEKPVISSERADMRRIIYCEFEPEGAPEERGFEDRLWDEGGVFLTDCVKTYARLCPDHAKIPCDTTEITDWVSVVEERFELLFQARFKLPHEDYRKTSGLVDLTTSQFELVTIKPEVMQSILMELVPDKKEQREFRSWMTRVHGVQKRTIRRPDPKKPGQVVFPKVYVGVNLRIQSVPSTVSKMDRLTT
jgi:phage/plasmid-associated DNA primase